MARSEHTVDEVNQLIRDAWEEGARRQRTTNALELLPVIERLEGVERYITQHKSSWGRLIRMVSANVDYLKERYENVT
jgi:hypothetical protein